MTDFMTFFSLSTTVCSVISVPGKIVCDTVSLYHAALLSSACNVFHLFSSPLYQGREHGNASGGSQREGTFYEGIAADC